MVVDSYSTRYCSLFLRASKDTYSTILYTWIFHAAFVNKAKKVLLETKWYKNYPTSKIDGRKRKDNEGCEVRTRADNRPTDLKSAALDPVSYTHLDVYKRQQ